VINLALVLNSLRARAQICLTHAMHCAFQFASLYFFFHLKNLLRMSEEKLEGSIVGTTLSFFYGNNIHYINFIYICLPPQILICVRRKRTYLHLVVRGHMIRSPININHVRGLPYQ